MARFLILALIFAVIDCKSKSSNNRYEISSSITTNYPDDKYCADVKYYNPNTGKQSSYRLTVGVENNEVVELDWPNGGTLDQDHFSAAELDDEGHTSLTSGSGYDYEIQIIGQTNTCFDGVPMVKQCRGITKAGRPCRNLTDNQNSLCWQHQNQD